MPTSPINHKKNTPLQLNILNLIIHIIIIFNIINNRERAFDEYYFEKKYFTKF